MSAILKNSFIPQGSSLAQKSRTTDSDESSWTLVGGDTFRVGDRVEKELPRFDKKDLRAAA